MKNIATLVVALAAFAAYAQTNGWTTAKNKVDQASAAYQDAVMNQQRIMGTSSGGDKVRACQVVAIRYTEWRNAVAEADTALKADIAKKERAASQASADKKEVAEEELRIARSFLPWMSDQQTLVKPEPQRCR